MVKGKSLICIVLVFFLYLIEVKVHIVTSCNCGLFSLASCFDSSINISWMFPKWVSGWVSAANLFTKLNWVSALIDNLNILVIVSKIIFSINQLSFSSISSPSLFFTNLTALFYIFFHFLLSPVSFKIS